MRHCRGHPGGPGDVPAGPHPRRGQPHSLIALRAADEHGNEEGAAGPIAKNIGEERSAAIAAILRDETPRPSAPEAFAMAICGRRFEDPS